MKRFFSMVMFLFVMIALSASMTYSADQPMSPQQEAAKLALKERWMRVPAELQLTPEQTTQFKEYASELRSTIHKAHHETVGKLKEILTPTQLDNLRQWGEAYRQKNEEQTKLTDDQMKASLEATSKQLHLNRIQEMQFKKTSLRFHRIKTEAFDTFCAKLDKILTDDQRLKFAEMKEDL